MTGDGEWKEKLHLLSGLTMKYEVAVIPLYKADYLTEFLDFYEIKNRDAVLVPSEEDFDGALRDLSGEYRWEAIAEKTKDLFGLPERVMVPDNDAHLREELEGPDGLAPFFFVFGLMFCEYSDFTLCFMSGSNN